MEAFRTQTAPLGPLHAVTTLYERGWEYDGEPEFQSFIGARFERADLVIRVIQDPGENLAFNAVAMPDELQQVLAQIGPTEFACWDFALGKAVRIDLVQDPEGRASLDIRGQYGSVRAKRV
jgi:hypothetical protein